MFACRQSFIIKISCCITVKSSSGKDKFQICHVTGIREIASNTKININLHNCKKLTKKVKNDYAEHYSIK